ncbi:uncharacterized protein LOC131218536 [Magnolia sinica]|uniref:uncharacterized protein LOC131218536 n=1 Tax=Magnolia sinica TaxID=86752 RepID=UPI00265B618D|nr:uncharacterized protein LOC131218536 [Magnolia sinica]
MSLAEPGSGTRPVLRPAGNRARVSELPGSGCKKAALKKSTLPRRLDGRVLESDGSCSSDSSGSLSSVRMADFRHRRKQNVVKSVKIVPDGVEVSPMPSSVMEKKRCGWITPNSDPLYASFHDEEWGVPVHDDRKLFELLVLSEALSELSWPTILNKRDTFRKLFDNFDPASVAKFSEKKLSLKASGGALLSEQKLRAVVENARQVLKVAEDFGSFSNYCWRFVNHKPVVNGFRYARQVPVKTPKAEAISKDMMQRGFRCVGPTIVYSFMQAAGIVNDHLSSCFRYKDCSNMNVKIDCETKVEEMEKLSKTMEQTCLLQA